MDTRYTPESLLTTIKDLNQKDAFEFLKRQKSALKFKEEPDAYNFIMELVERYCQWYQEVSADKYDKANKPIIDANNAITRQIIELFSDLLSDMTKFDAALHFLARLEVTNRNRFVVDDRYYPVKKEFYKELRHLITTPKQLDTMVELFEHKDHGEIRLQQEAYWNNLATQMKLFKMAQKNSNTAEAPSVNVKNTK